jgi:hypothetical protein
MAACLALLWIASVGGVERSLGRWKFEYQPVVANVHKGKLLHVAEEGAIRFRVLAVEQNVRADQHNVGSLHLMLKLVQ